MPSLFCPGPPVSYTVTFASSNATTITQLITDLAAAGKTFELGGVTWTYTGSSTVNGQITVTPSTAQSASPTQTRPTKVNGKTVIYDADIKDKVHHAGKNPVANAKLQLNGHDRFSERVGRYFNLVQPYQHHTNVPATGINVYSFGLKPEEHQPSGSCNFSRIDNAQLVLGVDAVAAAGAKLNVYALNYNVLRVMSGMGGLAYSN